VHECSPGGWPFRPGWLGTYALRMPRNGLLAAPSTSRRRAARQAATPSSSRRPRRTPGRSLSTSQAKSHREAVRGLRGAAAALRAWVRRGGAVVRGLRCAEPRGKCARALGRRAVVRVVRVFGRTRSSGPLRGAGVRPGARVRRGRRTSLGKPRSTSPRQAYNRGAATEGICIASDWRSKLRCGERASQGEGRGKGARAPVWPAYDVAARGGGPAVSPPRTASDPWRGARCDTTRLRARLRNHGQ
jgi:hypothetical protein